ncbi:MAG: carboxypeptidase-like regulatory domain-containing protein [bacterium]
MLTRFLLGAFAVGVGHAVHAQAPLRFVRQTEESTLRASIVDPTTLPALTARITLGVNAATRAEGLSAIVRASGLPLVFAKDLLPSGGVRLVGDTFTVRSALEATLAGADVEVFITLGGNLVLQRRAVSAAPVDETTIVVGTITLESGVPLSRATVTIDGSSASTSSDEEGRFALSSTRGRRVLHVRSPGFVPVNIALTLEATHMSVSLVTRRRSVQLDSTETVGMAPRKVP